MSDLTPPWTAVQPDRQQVRPLVSPEGLTYRLSVSRPPTAAPAAGFGAIVVLDGARHFQAVAAAAEALSQRTEKTAVEPLAVIGVAHDEPEAAIQDARARDFTSGPCPEPGWTRPHGQAAAFRRFLIEQALPAAAEAAPLDPQRRTLFGHSLGGLFVLETLETAPDLFSRWVAISPSLWWRTPGNDRADDRLLLGYGETETARDMRGRIEAWAARAPGPVLRMAPQADHGAAPFALIPDALRHASLRP